MTRETVGRMMEILLVEDSLFDARVAIGALQHTHVKHRCTLVRDGAEALEFLKRLGKFSQAPRPDLILLDLNLPRIDGIGVLTEIRADEALHGIPVVVLSASDDDNDRTRTELLQVDSFMTKPVNLNKFIEVVRQLKHYWFTDVVLAANGHDEAETLPFA